MSGTSQQPFAGFPGQTWACAYQALAWLNGLLTNNNATIGAVANPINLVYGLLRNASQSIDAYMTGNALAAEVSSLDALQALPITLDPTTTIFFNNRVTAIETAAAQIIALQPSASPFTVVASLTAGASGLLNSNYLTYLMSFSGETAPAGLTAANLVANAYAEATAWLNVANEIYTVQGQYYLTQAYDTAVRQYRCATTIASTLSQFQSGPFATTTNATQLWNSMVALPTILLDGESLATSPSSLAAQQGLVIRYALSQIANQLALLLYAINTAVGDVPVTAILNNNDTLLDLAARQLSNFEDWTQIASINALQPPYPGPTNPALALSGRQLYLPGSNVQLGSNTTAPTYPNSVMKVDYYFGPIYGAQPAWTGELPTIQGFLNFAAALGRRILTPLGSLVYHSNYGSRIPGEVGAVQSTDETNKLVAYATSAIQSDPRTGRVLSVSGSVEPGFLANISAIVQPIGPAANPVSLNASISSVTGT